MFTFMKDENVHEVLEVFPGAEQLSEYAPLLLQFFAALAARAHDHRVRPDPQQNHIIFIAKFSE